MSRFIEIIPVVGPIHGAIQPPGSKSITNRVLPIAAMAQGKSTISGVLDSDDTKAMIDSLSRLGFEMVHDPNRRRVTVHGHGGIIPSGCEQLFVGNSGTTLRFLTAMLGMAGGQYRIDGIARMRERPIGPLVDALNSIGADVVAESPNDCPPVCIRPSQLKDGTIRIRGNLSSQYLSGLLMAAPLAESGATIEIDGSLISKPYVEMTIQVMKDFGVLCDTNDSFSQFHISAGQTYRPTDYCVEPDASAASYFWAAAAICGGSATVTGLNRDSIQGDIRFVDCLEQMGCDVQWRDNEITVSGPAIRGIDVDMSNISDTVQTLAAVALFVDGATTVRNIAHNRVKETDRIGNLAIELRKFGVQVDERSDGLTIHPGPLRAAEIETYDDHRMAMSLALVGLRQSGVKILDPDCVAKTYPNYFQDLRKFVSP